MGGAVIAYMREQLFSSLSQGELIWANWWDVNRLYHLQFREAVSMITSTNTSRETIPISTTTLKTISQEVFIPCLKENKNAMTRATAALGLGKLKDKSVIPVLKEALTNDTDPYVKNTVALALAILEDEETLNNLNELAQDKNSKYSKLVDRANSLLMLGYLKNNKAVEALKNALDPTQKNDKEIQCAALIALANYRDVSLVPFICNILADGTRDANVRTYAAISLGIIKDPGALPALKKALSDRDSSIRSGSAFALGFIKSPDAKDDLINLINTEKKSEIKSYAILALAQIGDKSVYPIISNIVKKNDYYLASVGTLALGLLGDEKALPELREMVEKRNKPLCYGTAMLALGLLKDKKSVPAIMKVVETAKADEVNWKAAVQTLGMIGDAKATPVLKKIFNDTKRKCDLLTEQYDDLLIALTMLGERKEVLPFLNQQMRDNTLSYETKLHAIHGTGFVGNSDSIEPLTKFYKEEKDKYLQLFDLQSLVLLLEKEKVNCYCCVIAHQYFNVTRLLLEYIFYQ